MMQQLAMGLYPISLDLLLMWIWPVFIYNSLLLFFCYLKIPLTFLDIDLVNFLFDIAVGYKTFKYVKNKLSCIFLILERCYKNRPAKTLQISSNDVYCLGLSFQDTSSIR